MYFGHCSIARRRFSITWKIPAFGKAYNVCSSFGGTDGALLDFCLSHFEPVEDSPTISFITRWALAGHMHGKFPSFFLVFSGRIFLFPLMFCWQVHAVILFPNLFRLLHSCAALRERHLASFDAGFFRPSTTLNRNHCLRAFEPNCYPPTLTQQRQIQALASVGL